MAKTKKIVKYQLNTKLPHEERVHTLMAHYNSISTLFAMQTNTFVTAGESWDRFAERRKQLITGELNDSNWRQEMGEWEQRRLLNDAFWSSPECDKINDEFMQEYNSREDLQELYRACYPNVYWLFSRHGRQYHVRDTATPAHFAEAPESFRMFQKVYNETAACKMRELARETPFIEGDLVLLRDPYVGHRDHDPYYISPYSPAGREGQTTPDRSTQRIATVIEVSTEIGHWRGMKGSKVLKVIWMGKEDVESVEERYVKWHMRPTFKNGLKVRPAE